MEKKPESRIEILNRVSKTLDNSITNFRDYKAIYDHNATLNVIYIGMAQYAKQETKPVKEMVERLQAENQKMKMLLDEIQAELFIQIEDGDQIDAFKYREKIKPLLNQ